MISSRSDSAARPDSAAHVENLLVTGERIAPPPGVERWARIADQDEWIAQARRDPDAFWAERAARIAWAREPDAVLHGRIGDARWFPGGRLNATVSCLDRHVASGHGGAIAYRYLCETGEELTVSYADLRDRVGRLANALRADGVRAGDRVCIYMPLSIEGITAMLACARIGAVHSVVYAGLGATALADRIADAGAEVVLTTDVTYRRGRTIDLKRIVDDAVQRSPNVRRVVVWQRRSERERDGGAAAGRERDGEAYVREHAPTCEPQIVDASHPLFILYTSGTTGKPKGVVMTHGGYLVGAAAMLVDTTSLTPEDVYWCTSDIGWIVGHSLIVYGALANRLHSILREGSPDWPSPAATYEIAERYGVTMLYTAPTLARMLMRFGDELPRRHDLSRLRAIFCAGEPLNPEAWHFLHDVVGQGRTAVCNQWWQTELAAPAIGFLPSSTIRPDRSGKAFGPLRFEVVAPSGEPVPAGAGGLLVLRDPAPHMFVTIWNDPERFRQYFSAADGSYVAGDVATVDADGYFTVLGRADDVLNVAGHRIATADVESAFVSHPAVGEAAAIGKPDALKGEAIKAFVVLRVGHEASDALRAELVEHVRYHLGPIGTPSEIEFVPKLPKTRSGKIMRRLLKAQEMGAELGDTTTLEE